MADDFLSTLTWRGMLHQHIPGTAEQLQQERTKGYIGFDATAPSLHIGNLATIMLLRHFQLAGHQPIALVGGATTLAGDPSFKAAERELLPEEEIRYNEQRIKTQLEQFLDFEGENAAEMVNNYTWFKDFRFLDFLREVGKHIPISYMTAKESVKRRIETGLSYTEFSYQLLQGYDFYHLYTQHGVKLQMGGSDQWGNLTTGTELIRRKAGGSAFAITAPLITKADGSKFGKTVSGAVWLDPKLTSPYAFYQFWMNSSDEDAKGLIRVFTLLPQTDIEATIAQHAEAPHLRHLQQTLAAEVTTLVHGAAACQQAQQATQILFGKSTAEDLAALEEETLLAVCEGVPQTKLSRGTWAATPDVLTLLSTAMGGEVFPSKSEARRCIVGGGISLNQQRIIDPQAPLPQKLLQGQYLLIQKGKKKYHLLQLVEG